MRLRRSCWGLVLSLLLYSAAAVAGESKTWAYLGWWLPDAWRSAPLGKIDRLLFFALKVDANGAITERNGWPQKWGELRTALAQHGTPLDLTLTLFDVADFERLFSSKQAQARLLDEATTLAGHEAVAGLQLDVEIYSRLSPQLLENYAAFVRALSQRLRQQSPPRNLSVFYPLGGESALYDAVTLDQVNHVVMQGYDAHWRGSKKAGPVAPLRGTERVTWENALKQGLSLGVARERLLISFPLYGYEWEVRGGQIRSETVAPGVATSYAPLPGGPLPDLPWSAAERAKRHGAWHDPVSGSSYYQFVSPEGRFFEGWFEDQRALKRRNDFLNKERLGGIAFFMLGYDGSKLVDYHLSRQKAWRWTRHK